MIRSASDQRMPTNRQAATAAIEQAGVVAVIRMKDPAKLRASSTRSRTGGVRALEVTMTVPGAVELIAALAPTLPADFLLGAGTVVDAATATAVIDAGRAVHRQPGVPARGHRGLPRAGTCRSMPGCFSPTEILDAWDAGADIVKVFPATALGPGYIKDVRAPLPQVQADADRRRHARQRRRVDSGRRRRGRRRHRRCSTPRRSRPATFRRPRNRTRERIVASVRAARAHEMQSYAQESSRSARLMLRLSPPGFERFLQSPQFVATFGGGEANVAVSLAQFGLESYYVTRLPEARDRRRCGPRAARRRRADRSHPARRRSRSASTTPRPARASARRPSFTIARVRRSARWSRTRWTGRQCSPARAWFHVTGITPALGDKGAAATRGVDQGGARRRRPRQRRSQLPQEALDRERRRRK